MNENPSDSEEEILVYACFDDNIDVEQYRSIHVLGINENNPIIQMDNNFFKGKFENAIGTYMFFEEDFSPQSEDPLLDKLPEKNLKYVTKTRKLLQMKQACVTPKEAQDIPRESSEKDNDIEDISFEKIEDALKKFKDEFKLEEAELESPSAAKSEEAPNIN